VHEALSGIKSNWPQAQFSLDVTGLKDKAAVTEHSLQVEYEAAAKGYLTYLRVSSHGDMLARAVATGTGEESGTLSLAVEPPLGEEQAIFLFSDRPLTSLLGVRTTDISLGADREHARSLVRKIRQLQAQGVMLAARSIDYRVEAPAGQTQYTTRSVIRMVEAAAQAPSPAQAAPRFPTRIEFEFGSDRLTAASKRDLDVFGDAMLESLRDREVTLEGHTDAIGSDQYNLDLSVRRAETARRYLIESFGVSPRQVQATGKGKADPVASNDSETGRSQNRRVDFIFGAPGTAGREPATVAR